jgi:hypothetical protein
MPHGLSWCKGVNTVSKGKELEKALEKIPNDVRESLNGYYNTLVARNLFGSMSGLSDSLVGHIRGKIRGYIFCLFELGVIEEDEIDWLVWHFDPMGRYVP